MLIIIYTGQSACTCHSSHSTCVATHGSQTPGCLWDKFMRRQRNCLADSTINNSDSHVNHNERDGWTFSFQYLCVLKNGIALHIIHILSNIINVHYNNTYRQDKECGLELHPLVELKVGPPTSVGLPVLADS